MTHQKNGKPIVCSACQNGNCGDCAGIEGSYRCHCPKCQPICPRAECNYAFQRQVVSIDICKRCFTLKSLTGVCACP